MADRHVLVLMTLSDPNAGFKVSVSHISKTVRIGDKVTIEH